MSWSCSAAAFTSQPSSWRRCRRYCAQRHPRHARELAAPRIRGHFTGGPASRQRTVPTAARARRAGSFETGEADTGRTTNASMRLPEEVFARINGGVNARLLVQGSPVGVIVCHPWGPLGGSMHDPGPCSGPRASSSPTAAAATARFDFRSGIGCGVSSADDVFAFARAPARGAAGRAARVRSSGAARRLLVRLDGLPLAACAELGAGRCVGVAALARAPRTARLRLGALPLPRARGRARGAARFRAQALRRRRPRPVLRARVARRARHRGRGRRGA